VAEAIFNPVHPNIRTSDFKHTPIDEQHGFRKSKSIDLILLLSIPI